MTNRREGFTTTLDGSFSQWGAKASGTLTMRGPEPPDSTHCRGTERWEAIFD